MDTQYFFIGDLGMDPCGQSPILFGGGPCSSFGAAEHEAYETANTALILSRRDAEDLVGILTRLLQTKAVAHA